MMDSGPERMMEIDWNLAHIFLLGKKWLKGRYLHLVGLYISIRIKQKNIYYLFIILYIHGIIIERHNQGT
jgi:hypothetical protein